MTEAKTAYGAFKTVYLFAQFNEYDEGEPYFFTSFRPDPPKGYVVLGSIELPYTPPSRESLVAAKVAQYQEEIRQARVDAEVVAREKGEAIQKLLAITHNPGETS